MGVGVGVKGKGKLWDSSLEFQGPFELVGSSIISSSGNLD